MSFKKKKKIKGKTRHNGGNNKQITAKYPNKAEEIKKHFSTHTHTDSHVKAQRTQSRICTDTNKHISKSIKIKLQKIYNALKKH